MPAGVAGRVQRLPVDGTLGPSPPPPTSLVVSGILSEMTNGASRPLAGRQVNLWIQESRTGRSQTVSTDQNGRYSAQVPAARVFAAAWHPPDQQQPCLASAAVSNDTTLDVQVFQRASPSRRLHRQAHSLPASSTNRPHRAESPCEKSMSCLTPCHFSRFPSPRPKPTTKDVSSSVASMHRWV